MQTFIIEQSGSIKKFLHHACPFLSQLQITTLLKKKDIKVNGKRISQDIALCANDTISVYFDFDKYLSSKNDIIYIDDNLLIINKMQGIETTSDNANNYTLEKHLSQTVGEVFAVHRLDTNTKGLVIFARNKTAKNELENAIKNHSIKKIYQTICYSKRKIEKATLTDYVKLNKTTQTLEKTAKNIGNVAILHILEAEKLTNTNNVTIQKQIDSEILNNLYFVTIKLETGRTHQIRFQLSQRQIFVLGDGKYGEKEINHTLAKDKQYLCATSLQFDFESTSLLHYLNDLEINISPNFVV